MQVLELELSLDRAGHPLTAEFQHLARREQPEITVGWLYYGGHDTISDWVHPRSIASSYGLHPART